MGVESMAVKNPLKILVDPTLQDVADALSKKGHEVQVMEDLAKADLVIGPMCSYYPGGAGVEHVDTALRGALARKKQQPKS